MIDDHLQVKLSQRQALFYFGRVLREAREQRWMIALCLFGSLLEAGIEVRLPQLMASGIDQFMISKASGPARMDGLMQLGLVYLGLVLLAAVLGFLLTLGFNRVGQTVVERLRNHLFEHLHRLPIGYFDGNPVGRLVTRVANDTGTLSEFFTGVVANLLCDLLKLLVLLGALFWASPRLTLSVLVLAPPALLASLLFQRANTRVNRDIRRLLAQLNAFIQENLQGLATLKSFTAEAKMQGDFDRQNREYLGVEMRLVYLYMLFRPLFGTISMLSLAIVLWVGGWQVTSGQISLGTLVLFVFYLKMLFAPLDDLAERFNVLQSAAVAAERLFLILDAEPESPGGQPVVSSRGRIEFRDVHFAYDPKKPVLQGVSFVLEPGQKLALVGATGSGKTTVTSLLQRLYPLVEGEILLDGVDIRQLQVDSLRRQFGIIQQELFLFKASLRHNVTLYRSVSEPALAEALRISRAARVVEAHPEGLERRLGERGNQLSQGERQLVSFARALVDDPPVLIMDEATASIDSLTEQAIQEALHEVLQGRTAILVAHRLSTIQHCDQILLLDHGKVVERGTHRELMEQDGAYANLVRHQLEKA
ncbi:MAG: ABC transporter ATP-binding protein [Candidatus Eremiobacteraeota bacterium]|nr:ABC transporter ATP-binding protein [Candidatus Eremiobacteraeota bacterium]